MGQGMAASGIAARASVGACALAFLLALTASAQAAPFHPRNSSLDVTGLNHACGVAVDSKGDFYASSAGESKIKVYNPSHVLLTEISDANTPCGLAVTTTGILYVSEQATGEVVRFKPNAYPFSGTPTYGSREVIDASTKAKGIAVDRTNSRLYVAEGTKIAVYKSDGTFETNLGEGTLTEASGVAPYTYSNGTVTNRYLWVADAKGIEADRLYLFAGTEVKALSLRRELKGANTPDGSFGFGTAGAYLAADPGNRSGKNASRQANRPAAPGTSSSTTPPTKPWTSSTQAVNTSTAPPTPPSPTRNPQRSRSTARAPPTTARSTSPPVPPPALRRSPSARSKLPAAKS